LQHCSLLRHLVTVPPSIASGAHCHKIVTKSFELAFSETLLQQQEQKNESIPQPSKSV